VALGLAGGVSQLAGSAPAETLAAAPTTDGGGSAAAEMDGSPSIAPSDVTTDAINRRLRFMTLPLAPLQREE
jgi:hypothetical protein